MTFADTSHINLNILLSSQSKAQNFIQRFIDEHKKDTSSFNSAIRKMLFSSNFGRQYQGLAQFYQTIIIPTLGKEIEEAAKKEVEQEWKRQGKQIYCQKTLFNGKVMNDTTNSFDLAVQRRVEEKKKKNKEYQRRVKEQTRLGSADGILKGAKVESNVPSGFGMNNGNDDDYSPPPPEPTNNGYCYICQRKCDHLLKRPTGTYWCVHCYRWNFKNNLKNLDGWGKLDSQEQNDFLNQVDNCWKRAEFRAVNQSVLNAIQNEGDDDDKPSNPIHKIFLAAWDDDPELQKLIAKYGLSNNKNWFLSIANETFLNADKSINYGELEKFFQQNISPKSCSECSKKFYGTCWTIGEGSSELFCSEGCAKTWRKKGPNDDSGEEIIEDDGNDLPTNDPPVKNNIPGENNDNSESSNTPNQDNNQLPSNNQPIANLPFPQAQLVAEQKIEKLLKDNNISEQELIQLVKTAFSGKSNWKNYLKSLDTPAKVAQFVSQMQQAILKMKSTNKTQNEDKNPENGWILPVAISVVSFLALTTLVLIVRKRKRKNR